MTPSYARLLAVLTLAVMVSGCAQFGAIVSNWPADPNCIPGSVTKPCR